MSREGEGTTNTPKKKPRRRTVKPIPDDAFSNRQLSLFQEFLGDKGGLSNAVDLWDNTPRFSITRRKQEQLRINGGFLPISTLNFKYEQIPFVAEIRPARLKLFAKDGKETGETIEFYPSAREELIEHALRKIAIEQQAGFFDKPDLRSGCRFSLYQLRRHLEDQGHALRYDELIEGLEILFRSEIDIKAEGQTHDIEGSGTYLTLIARVKKRDLRADPDSKWVVQFHPLITDSIEKVTYRQFNYKRLMNCRTQLARWLISQLVLKYTNAALVNTFTMKFSTIKRDSALLSGYTRERDAVAALDAAWEEVKGLGVLTSFKKSEQRSGRAKLEDVSYLLHPSLEFSTEQKAANRRQHDDRMKNSPLQQQALTPFIEQVRTPQGLAALVDKTDKKQKERGE
jgi:hypothetical protein